MKKTSIFLILLFSAICFFSSNLSLGKDVDIVELFLASMQAGFDKYDNGEYEESQKYFNQAYEVCEKFPEYKDKIGTACDKLKKYIDGSDIKNSDDANDELECEKGYIHNETETQCVKDSFEQRKLNCSTRYGNNTEFSSDGECICKEGYIWNASQTQCIPYSVEQMEANCTIWYGENAEVVNYNECNCKKGYTWSYDDTFCDVDLSQKSLSSRIMNSIDAKCDNTEIIANCEKNPTGDSCPGVCLEMYDAINRMYDNGLTIYKDPTKFGIYNEMTREQSSKFFVKFYTTVFKKNLAVPAKNPFNDVDNADPTLYNFIQYAYGLNLFKGNNGKFMPFNHLSKAQTLAVIIRMAFGMLEETSSPWYSNYLYKAESLDLLDNIKYSQSTLDDEDILRGDVALMLYRLYIYFTYFK